MSNYPTQPSEVAPALQAAGITIQTSDLRRIVAKVATIWAAIERLFTEAAKAAGSTTRTWWTTRATTANVLDVIVEANRATEGQAWRDLLAAIAGAPAPAPAPAPGDLGGLGLVLQGLQEALAAVGGKVDQQQFDELLADSATLRAEIEALRELIAKAAPRDVRVVTPDSSVVVRGPVHRMFPRLVSNIAFRRNSWLYGPAGSSKTSTARLAARTCTVVDVRPGKPVQVNTGTDDAPRWRDAVVTDCGGDAVDLATYTFAADGLVPGDLLGTFPRSALRLAFLSESLSAQATRADLSGFRSALDGRYYGSKARLAFEYGALYCLDEVDASNPNVLTGLNEMLNVDAGESCPFPDGMIRRSADFVCIATANTIGAGASSDYVGRLPIDAATKDRFSFLRWNYDVEMERAIVASHGEAGIDWLETVVVPIRAAITDLGAAAICSPRMTFAGAAMLAATPASEREATKAILVAEMFANKLSEAEASRILDRAKVKADCGW